MSDSSHDRSQEKADVTPLPADDSWSAQRPELVTAPSVAPELDQAPQLAPASELTPAPAAEVLKPEDVPPETDARVAALLQSIDQGFTPIAEKARHRLSRRYRHLCAAGKRSQVALAAVARELVGFIWALAHAAGPRPA